MAKNIVICSDGTGNTFSQDVSNVTHLIHLLELGHPSRQLVFYDQGLGTNPKLVARIKAYRHEPHAAREGLRLLREPGYGVRLSGRLGRLAALTVGYGLRENVKEMYQALAQSSAKGDHIFLFGFSRGAFTVRALAGLLYRCGLPRHHPAKFSRMFDKAYSLYKRHDPDPEKLQSFRTKHRVRDCRIHFLGIWDTVKSYGGMWPTSLPHLRHNPIVKTVRHALALDEHRSWFIPTSWGGIDSDKPMALGVEPDDRYASQDVQEVWFRGCHSDVGGGDQEVETARIPLRWMLSEAAAHHLVLNREGHNLLRDKDEAGVPVIHESLTLPWRVAEYLPRFELDNSVRPPKRFFKCGRSGKRSPLAFKRAGTFLLHSSVRAAEHVEVKYVHTPTI